MKKSIFRTAFVIVLTICLAALPALAKKGGQGQSPGWDSGEKQVWQNTTPPGLEYKEAPGEKNREKVREQQKTRQHEKNREKVRKQKKTNQGEKNRERVREQKKTHSGEKTG